MSGEGIWRLLLHGHVASLLLLGDSVYLIIGLSRAFGILDSPETIIHSNAI